MQTSPARHQWLSNAPSNTVPSSTARLPTSKPRSALAALFIATALLVPASAMAGDEKYTMEDLVALDKAGDWGELIEHLEDVRPSKRKGNWTTMAERAAIGRVDEFVKRNEKQQAYAEAERILLDIAVLKKSRKFLDKRAEVGLAMFADCLNHRGGKPCVDGLKGLVNTDPAHKSLAFDAAKLVRRGYNASSALRLFEKTITKKDKRCDDGALWLAVESGFNEPPNEGVQMAEDIAFNRCGKTQKAKVNKLFLSLSPTSYGFRNLCPAMKKAKRLSKFQKAVCDDVKEKK